MMEYYDTSGQEALQILEEYAAEIKESIKEGKVIGFKSEDYLSKGEKYFTIKVCQEKKVNV